jgi:hypothetical protein
MISILYCKYYYIFYILAQNCLRGSENDNHSGTERGEPKLLQPHAASSTANGPQISAVLKGPPGRQCAKSLILNRCLFKCKNVFLFFFYFAKLIT